MKSVSRLLIALGTLLLPGCLFVVPGHHRMCCKPDEVIVAPAPVVPPTPHP